MGTVEQKHSQLAQDTDDELVKRRVALTNAYQALPVYGSTEFWHVARLKVALIVLAIFFPMQLCMAVSAEHDTFTNLTL
jgi:poly-D-alanine transfer protein DltD